MSLLQFLREFLPPESPLPLWHLQSEVTPPPPCRGCLPVEAIPAAAPATDSVPERAPGQRSSARFPSRESTRSTSSAINLICSPGSPPSFNNKATGRSLGLLL